MAGHSLSPSLPLLRTVTNRVNKGFASKTWTYFLEIENPDYNHEVFSYEDEAVEALTRKPNLETSQHQF